MVPETSGNLRQLWEGLRHLSMTLFRKFLAFRDLWYIQNGSKGLWQIKTIIGRFKTLVEASSIF